MKKIVSVVLPTYNEKANIENTVEKVLNQEKNLPGWEIHVVIADDIRSSDGTYRIAQNLSQKNSCREAKRGCCGKEAQATEQFQK